MTAPLMEAADLGFSLGAFRLENIRLRLAPGDGVSLAGPNGAGKSTLLRLLAGLHAPGTGRVLWEGADLARLSPRERARRVAWVPPEMDAPPSMAVDAAVAMGFFPRARWGGWIPTDGAQEELERLLRVMGLLGLRKRAVGALSGGERRRVGLARGLAQGARVLLLDEPTAHLDPKHQAELVALIDRLRREDGVAVVMASHDLNLALEACPRLLLLKDGRALHDGPAAALTPAVLEQAYGLPAEIHPGHIRFRHHT